MPRASSQPAQAESVDREWTRSGRPSRKWTRAALIPFVAVVLAALLLPAAETFALNLLSVAHTYYTPPVEPERPPHTTPPMPAPAQTPAADEVAQ